MIEPKNPPGPEERRRFLLDLIERLKADQAQAQRLGMPALAFMLTSAMLEVEQQMGAFPAGVTIPDELKN